MDDVDIKNTSVKQFVSVVVPLYNEEENVALLHRAITAALQPAGINYELIFVNDGSRDKTQAVAAELTATDPRLKVVEFRKNYGQTPAMAAGIDLAQGDVIVTMDGDLQNDPSDIPAMINQLNSGFDIVVGWRRNRQDKLATRKIPSRIANWLIGKVTGIPIRDNGCSLKVYRADVMQRMPFYNEMHRFIPALVSLSGARIAEVKVKHHARRFGTSKYGLSRIYKVLFDIITIKTILSFVNHPVRWFARLAAVPLVLSTTFFVLTFTTSDTMFSNAVMASMAVIMFSLSVFLISLGFICELTYSRGTFKVRDLAPLTARVYTHSHYADQLAGAAN